MRKDGKPQGRIFKRQLYQLLTQEDFESALSALRRLPARKIISPLLAFLFNGKELIKWRGVRAVGAVTAGLAETDMESARIVIRRLIWSLNDESGGIGWGSPEAMGEIMACHKGLAEEYAHILISYARTDGSCLEHDLLQGGLLWGLGRLAQVFPHLVQSAGPYVPSYLASGDPTVRGLAATLCGILHLEASRPALKRLKSDKALVRFYCGGRMRTPQVGRMAELALRRL